MASLAPLAVMAVQEAMRVTIHSLVGAALRATFDLVEAGVLASAMAEEEAGKVVSLGSHHRSVELSVDTRRWTLTRRLGQARAQALVLAPVLAVLLVLALALARHQGQAQDLAPAPALV
jgi:hypothetical protein